MCPTRGRSHLISTQLFVASPSTVNLFHRPLCRLHPKTTTHVKWQAHCSNEQSNSGSIRKLENIQQSLSSAGTSRETKSPKITSVSSPPQAFLNLPRHLLHTIHRYIQCSIKCTATAAALATAFAISTTSVNAATNSGRISQATVAVSQQPGRSVVIFDKDFASSWKDGTANPLSLSQDATTNKKNETTEKQQQRSIKSDDSEIQQSLGARTKSVGGGLPSPSLALEVRILSRLLVALVVGGIIGMERRAANSLAGVRTFSLVSLGAAIFMTTTLTAFPNSDPTRIAAAISSSVGFLGAGAMHKNSKHSRGLTTASSVWLAAALGIAAAAGLFLLSFSGAVATVVIARYARFDSSLHLIRGDPLNGLSEVDEIHDDTTIASNSNPSNTDSSLRFHQGNGAVMSRLDGHRNKETHSLDELCPEDEDDDMMEESSKNGTSKQW